MSNAERFVAFRGFGDAVHWPPVVGVPKTRQAAGAIEIFFVRDPAKNTYAACVRWLARGRYPGGSGPWPVFDGALSAIRSVHEFSTAQLTEAFEQAIDGELVYRFDKWGGHASKGERLRFDGVAVLEQYVLPSSAGDDTGPASCQMRIPLLGTYRIGPNADELYHSGIQIGHHDHPSLRLNLGLRLPAPITEKQRQHGASVLAFSALYSAQLDSLAAASTALAYNDLTYGAPGADVDVALESGTLADISFAQFGNKQGYAIPKPAAPWPTPQTILKGVLAVAGIRCAGKHLDTSFQEDTDLSWGSPLIRMPSVTLRALAHGDGEAPRFLLRQSYAIRTDDDAQGAIDEAHSDIRVRKGQFQIRAPGGGDRWLTTGGTIYIVIEVEGSIADATDPQPAMSVGMRIGWSESLEALAPSSDLLRPAPSMSAGADVPDLLAAVLASMRLAHANLRHLSPVQPQSMLPEVRLADGLAHQQRYFALFAKMGGVQLDEYGNFPVASYGPALGKFRVSLESMDVLADPDQAIDHVRLPLTAKWPSFHYGVETAEPSRTLAMLHERQTYAARKTQQRSNGKTPDHFVWLAIEELATTAAKLHSSLGGMVFFQNGTTVLHQPTDLSDQASTLHFGAREKINLGLPLIRSLAAGNFELKLLFSVDSATPVGVDVARGDRSGRPAPVLLQEKAAATAGDARYHLAITETIDDDTNWRLLAALNENDKWRADVKTVLFSEQPFAIQRFWSSPLGSLGDAGTTTVANYDSDDGVWEIKRDGRSYHYVLPPQSVGESMDKPRRLELHDAAAGHLERHDYLSPVPPNGAAALSPNDIALRRHPVEFRLTPPAELWIEPADVERNYFAPQWASARIFRQKSELGVGAALIALRAEFVYGLPVSVIPRAERGPARRARVAEIEALMGHPLAADEEARDDAELRWTRVRSVLARRPERLEVWADDPGSTVAFAPARFVDSARFCLRPTALHRPPVPAADLTTLDGMTWPHQRVPGISPRLHPRGLAGGALWPIESHNVLNMVLDAPAANGGSIEQIALSPHGGDAEQDAKFCNGRVSIITSTRSGFVQRQKVEVLGRIGVFWHRAKHVVIYERTVNPSAQFTPEGGVHSRTRRPVLRKISEYVEIIQPERRYPDMAGAAPHTSGFLRGMRFNSLIIPVDSAWAEDIGAIGWQIPLWNRHAARVRPQVYPRPDSAFVTACEGKEKGSETAQECLNPDNLYFFADTTPEVDDRTDLWKTRLGIDFTNLPSPCHGWPVKAAATDPASAGAQDSSNAPRVPPGFGRFTWSLAPSSQRTTINAGRTEQPVYTALESITFMRAGGVAAGSAAATNDPLSLAGGLRDAGMATIFSGSWEKGKPVQAPDGAPLVDFSKKLAGASAALLAGFPAEKDDRDQIKAILTALKAAAASAASGALETRVGEISGAYQKKFGDFAGELNKIEGALPSYCTTMKANLSAALGAKRLAMVQEVRSWEAETVAAIAAAPGPFELRFDSEQSVRDYLEEQLHSFLLPVFSAAEVEIGKLRRGIETTKSAVGDARAEMLVRIKDDVARLQALRYAMDLEKPWSEVRMAQFGGQLDDVFRRALDGIAASIEDARRRLATELDDLSQRVGTAAARVLDGVAAGQLQVDQWLGLNGKLEAQVRVLSGTLAMHRAQIDGLAGDVGKALVKAKTDKPEHAAKIDAILQRIDQFKSLVNSSTSHADQLGTALVHAGRSVSAATATAAGALREMAGADGSSLQEILKELDKDLPGVQKNILAEVRAALEALRLPLQDSLAEVLALLARGGNWVDAVIAEAARQVDQAAQRCVDVIDAGGAAIDEAADYSLQLVGQAEAALAPDNLVAAIVGVLLDDVQVKRLVQKMVLALAPLKGKQEWRDAARLAVGEVVGEIVGVLEKPFSLGALQLDELEKTCQALAGGLGAIREELTAKAEDLLEPLRARLDKYTAEVMDGLDDALVDAKKYAELVGKFDGFERDVRRVGSDLASAGDKARAYGERLVDAIGNIGAGGLDAAPGNILKAFAAAGDPPTMPNLDFAKERLAFYLGAVNDVVDITPVTAYFGGLAEGLASMGLNAPCDRIGNWLETMDLSKLDIGAVIDKFAGCELGKLLKGQKFANPMGDAIRITHDFDQKRARAWVRIDVNVPMDGRHPLFMIGPFSLDLVDACLVGHVRLEAAADSDKVEQSGSASITTGFDAVVGGQSMVTLNKVEIRYDKSGSLKVDFDPRNIKLNPTFQFIQNTLQSIVGDELGGLKIVKRDGIPVGVEHLFSMPPMSLMFGTSGVQNLQIANQFQLLAYPDFMIANRFSLARPDLPFIFSVFIIGGTGWLTVDCEYRPFQDELLVVVEAGAGGSASLGFAFAGCTGSVAITLSVALTYRKLIGQPGGGLTVSLVVLIVGTIDVLCIANATLSLLLRLSYRENGDIDASGTFRLKVRISRFFQVSASGEARYAMRGGKSESSSSTRTDYKVTDENLNKARKLIEGQKG